jgi:hypothetical protein
MSMSHEDYLRKFSAKTLQTFRRKLRLLEKEANASLELVRVRHRQEIDAFLTSASGIVKNSWQRHLIDLDVNQPAERKEVLEAMAEGGMLRSYLLRAGSRIFAFLIGFQLNGVFYFHETAYDDKWARFSPGQ